MAGFENISLNGTDAAGINQTEVAVSGMDFKKSYIIAAGFILLLSFLGIVGNSLVFWYLSFSLKRTKYTVYIINLAVADLIYLISISILMSITISSYLEPESIANPDKFVLGLELLLGAGSNADMFFLTAIVLERCLAVHYPIWYQNNRPRLQSMFVSIFIWGLSILVTLVDNMGCPTDLFHKVAVRCTAVEISLTILVFLVVLPTMVSSSLIMLIKIRRTSKRVQPPKLIIVIVVSILVFVISVAPMRLLWLLLYLHILQSNFISSSIFFAACMCFTIHSSVNPLIYFLVGRDNMVGVWDYFKNALKKVFKEEDEEEGHGEKKNKEEENNIDA